MNFFYFENQSFGYPIRNVPIKGEKRVNYPKTYKKCFYKG